MSSKKASGDYRLVKSSARLWAVTNLGHVISIWPTRKVAIREACKWLGIARIQWPAKHIDVRKVTITEGWS